MNLLRSPLFWLLLVVFAGAAVLIVRRTTGSQSWGFLDLVKNPHLWNEMSDGQEEVEKDIRAAQTWNTGKVTRAVRHFIFDVETGSDAWGERKVLD